MDESEGGEHDVSQIDQDGRHRRRGANLQRHYYEAKTLRGTRRYSSEVLLGPGDRIILDDDSVNSLESKIARLVPATVYSRMLAAKASVDA